jgi:hypothetical protein
MNTRQAAPRDALPATRRASGENASSVISQPAESRSVLGGGGLPGWRWADDGALRGQRARSHRAGDAKVDDPGAVTGQDDVGGLEITVDEAAGMNGSQSLR